VQLKCTDTVHLSTGNPKMLYENWASRYWRRYLSAAKYKWCAQDYAYGPADSIVSCFSRPNIQMVVYDWNTTTTSGGFTGRGPQPPSLTAKLLRCDWLVTIRLIITRSVRAVWLVSKVSRYLSILCLWLRLAFKFPTLTACTPVCLKV